MTFSLTVPAHPRSIRVVRADLVDWLDRCRWPATEQDPLVFAAAEAVTNAVEHAYPGGDSTGTVTVAAREQLTEPGRQIVVTVVDQGSWNAGPTERDSSHLGLQLMRAFAADVRIDTSPVGTTVTIASTVVAREPSRSSR